MVQEFAYMALMLSGLGHAIAFLKLSWIRKMPSSDNLQTLIARTLRSNSFKDKTTEQNCIAKYHTKTIKGMQNYLSTVAAF